MSTTKPTLKPKGSPNMPPSQLWRTRPCKAIRDWTRTHQAKVSRKLTGAEKGALAYFLIPIHQQHD